MKKNHRTGFFLKKKEALCKLVSTHKFVNRLLHKISHLLRYSVSIFLFLYLLKKYSIKCELTKFSCFFCNEKDLNAAGLF